MNIADFTKMTEKAVHMEPNLAVVSSFFNRFSVLLGIKTISIQRLEELLVVCNEDGEGWLLIDKCSNFNVYFTEIFSWQRADRPSCEIDEIGWSQIGQPRQMVPVSVKGLVFFQTVYLSPISCYYIDLTMRIIYEFCIWQIAVLPIRSQPIEWALTLWAIWLCSLAAWDKAQCAQISMREAIWFQPKIQRFG